ncbi:putative very-long-chain enoyl-CoA reductase art-1 [Tubulanus polymorphus]|uniref:putative very-long-chain enoyl-CoA reductase art-1 n=1 Tax=Tubulanus polymorphus TaxID=672921 RepID=UPI003DA45667
MELEVVDSRSGKTITTLKNTSLCSSSTIRDVKREFQKIKRKLYPDRQSFRIEPRGKSLKDEETLENLKLTPGDKIFFKDLGPQIGWITVFLAEYAGPLVIYLLFYYRPSLVYGEAASTPVTTAAHIAAGCWSTHYLKRLIETLFVHRFSHATMPISNLFKNCSYYWGFTAFVAYFNNHPLYTPARYGDIQLYGGLAAFIFSQLGNFSIHLSLRNLRPPGTKERKIPYPSMNQFTWLFYFVSCPNYTYEALAWTSFSILSQSLPALLFTAAGFYQMAVWALGKHRNYKKEFKNYPRGRKAIIPFIL